MEKLFLIDGTAIIYRTYFAFIRNPLINSKGQNTSAIYGTINTFLRMIDKYDVKNSIISFDRKEKTFRHKLDQSYKANRPPAPDDLISQIEPIKTFFSLINIPEVSKSGYEADDVLATLAEKFKDKYEIIMVTGDKDFSQLVDKQVKLYNPFKESFLDINGVQEKYGLDPEQFIDYLAICGDTADNIPGVKGLGPKGATKLLQQFGSLENIYNNLDEISAKGTRGKLEEHKTEAFLSQELAKIIRDVPLDNFDEIDVSVERKAFKNAIEFLKEYELNALIKKIKPVESSNEEEQTLEDDSVKYGWKLIENNDQFKAMLDYIKPFEVVAIDTETTSTDPLVADLVGISLAVGGTSGFYISIRHQMAENLPIEIVMTELQKVLKNKLLLAHNIKYDYLVLQRSGYLFENTFFDTMIADYLLNPTSRHSLADCAQRCFNYEMIPIKSLIGKGKKQVTFDLVPSTQAAEYSVEDVIITYRLYEIYKNELKNRDLEKLYAEIEMPLFKTLATIEKNGVFVDKNFLVKLSKKNQLKLAELTLAIYEIAGYQFNLNSTQQLGKVLFEDLGIPPIKKTKSGYSTDITVLETLAKEHEIARLLMDYRQITKMESTYIKALPLLIIPETGRIHSSFNQTVASTGRLSSSNPNLQNIPIRSEMGKEIRKSFVVQDKNNVILAADYSQIELRLLAILSNDHNLIHAFKTKVDIHRQTASIIFEKDLEDITFDERRYAKIINFGLIYGMGAFRISNELNISRKEAAQFIENYFAKFPTIKDYIQHSIDEAKHKGYAETIFGRKLYLPGLNSSNKMRVKEAERVATNMPIQGSAADIIKIAMNILHEQLKDRDDIIMMIQVHDELVFEVKKDSLEEAKEIITTVMEHALPQKWSSIVSLNVDVGVGDNWYEAH